MKTVNVLNFNQFLSNLKVNKFDKEIRFAIIKNSILANNLVKQFEDSVKSANERVLSEINEEEVNLLNEYRTKYKTASDEEKSIILQLIVNDCKNALTAEHELNETVKRLSEEEVNEVFVKMDKNNFINQCADADIDITPAMLVELEELFN